jgi:hypothetical protein
MSPIFSTRLTVGALAALLSLPIAPVYASYTISCNSNGYRYQYWQRQHQRIRAIAIPDVAGALRARPQLGLGQRRRVGQQRMQRAVRSGRPVGLRGRRGQQRRRGSGGDRGLAILGAVIANHDREQTATAMVPAELPGGRRSGPGWAVGTFNGSLWGQRQTIQIGPDGGANVWYRNGGSAQGWFAGSTLTIGNNTLNVQPSGGGILVNGAYFGR